MANNPSKAKIVFEPESKKELLRGWLRHSHKGRQRHDRAARRLDDKKILLGGLAAVFAAIVGTSIFTSLEKDSSTSLKVIIGITSMLSAILSGLNAFLNLSERSEKHRSAGVRYKAMIRELERRISEEVDNQNVAYSDLENIQRRLDELEENAPIVPERIFLLVDNEWNARGVEAATKADNL